MGDNSFNGAPADDIADKGANCVDTEPFRHVDNSPSQVVGNEVSAHDYIQILHKQYVQEKIEMLFGCQVRPMRVKIERDVAGLPQDGWEMPRLDN
jgi:hypothetical protein